ncbi:MAG: glycosyltransferase family 2 protein [candidate division WOR-3 bacterium]|nr:glycosyltransferase family 2 protein [candidate division WOR-3 bacterium]
MDFNKKLSIIIVNYNTKDLVLQCLNSVANLSINTDYEVFVVDNNSSDGSAQTIKALMPWVNLIENHENLGFAKANNQAIKLARGEYILLLNPDTKNVERAIEKTLEFIENHSEIDAITCRVELANGELDWACHRGFPTPWASFSYFVGLEKIFPKSKLFGQYHLTYLSLDKPHEIEVPSGCFFMVRRKVVEKVGLLDESYFMYGEDVDWAYRIKKAGGKIYFYPDAKIIHYKGCSSGIKKETQEKTFINKTTKINAVNYFYDAMKIFYNKHYKTKYPFFINWLVYLGIEIKRGVSLIRLRV